MIIGDWGLGIGDCPIPNPQSPNFKNINYSFYLKLQKYNK